MTKNDVATPDNDDETKKKGFIVDKVRVFLTGLPGVGEGIVSVPTAGGLIPMVALDDRQFKAFSEMSQDLADESGREIWVAEFTARKDIARFERRMVQIPKIGGDKFKIGG